MWIKSKLFDWVGFPKKTFTESENSILDNINVQKILKKVRIYIYYVKKEITRSVFFLV